LIMLKSQWYPLVLTLVFVYAVEASTVQASTANNATTTRILVLGDSISAGYGMSLESSWVSLLAQVMKSKYPGVSVINASISGETSAGGRARLPALLDTEKPDIVVIELGGNDGLRGFPIKVLRENLTAMTRQAQATGARVILVQMEILPNYGRRYTSAFSDSFGVVAEETGAVLAPFILDGVATDDTLMQADQIHPRASAQPRLLENFLPTLLPMLESQ